MKESSDRYLSSADVKETGRIEAFSDGVFSIAITLLILNIKVPHLGELAPGSGLFDALFAQWASYLAFLISFTTILIMWAHHHNLFTLIKKCDGIVLFLNGLVLLMVTFVPFPTALLAEHIEYAYAKTAAAVYSGTYVMIAIFYNLLWHYASSGGRLLGRNVDAALVSRITKQYRLGPSGYLIAFALSFISPPASVLSCVLLAVFFAVTAGAHMGLLDQKAKK